jgi:hypothetical protein
VFIADRHGLTTDMIIKASRRKSVHSTVIPAQYHVQYLILLGNLSILWGGSAMGVPHDYKMAKCHFGLLLNLYFDAYTQK